MSGPAGPGGRRVEWLLAAVSLSLTGLCLWGAEHAYRLWERRHPVSFGGAHLGELHVHSERYGWSPRPHLTALVDLKRVTINAHGQRGRAHRLARRPGRRRVVLLGDSVAFGYGVADHETFAALLEARDPALEVVNLAVEGYGTGQQLLRLQHEGLAYRPDVVLLHVCIENDAVDNWRPAYLYDPRFAQPYFRLDGQRLVLHDTHLRVTPAGRALAWVDRRSRLVARLGTRPGPLPALGAGAAWRQAKDEVLRDPRDALRLTHSLILEAARLARAHGAELRVVLHPNRRALEGRPSLLASLRDAPELGALARLDLAAHYTARGLGPRELLLDGSGHLNSAGHALTAELLQPWTHREPPPRP